MAKHHVVVEMSETDGFTGVVGIFTDVDRAFEVAKTRRLLTNSYSYYVEHTKVDPTDEEIY